MIITSKDPQGFQTQAIEVTPYAGGINITPTGTPVDFTIMQLRRRACSPSIPGKFANLGVSAQIHLTLQGLEYLLLVRQQKKEHSVLKLPSGYVPIEQLSNPWLTLAQELAEECLLLEGKQFGRCLLNDRKIVKPYPELDYHDSLQMAFTSEVYNPLDLPQAKVCIGQKPLTGHPMLYIHKQTCSAQLVYPLRLELPDSDTLSLLHAEEQFNAASNQLDVVMNTELWLAQLKDGRIRQLNKLIRGKVQPIKAPAGTRLSEVFAPRQPVTPV